jgi:hypothetical protein
MNNPARLRRAVLPRTACGLTIPIVPCDRAGKLPMILDGVPSPPHGCAARPEDDRRESVHRGDEPASSSTARLECVLTLSSMMAMTGAAG